MASARGLDFMLLTAVSRVPEPAVQLAVGALRWVAVEREPCRSPTCP